MFLTYNKAGILFNLQFHFTEITQGPRLDLWGITRFRFSWEVHWSGFCYNPRLCRTTWEAAPRPHLTDTSDPKNYRKVSWTHFLNPKGSKIFWFTCVVLPYFQPFTGLFALYFTNIVFIFRLCYFEVSATLICKPFLFLHRVWLGWG